MSTNTVKNMRSTTFEGARSCRTLRGFAARLAVIALASVSIALITLGAAAVANGQNQNRVRTYNQRDIERLIRDVEQSSKQFRRDFDNWLDRSPLDGQAREDQYNRQVKDLTNELGTLRSNFNKRNDWWLARSDMQRVLIAATLVNSALNNTPGGRSLARQWNRLRRNINLLTQAFNLPQVGSTYTITRPVYDRPGSNARNCQTGTYRGYTNTGESELTILNNGVASIRSLVSGEVYSGRCDNDTLYFDWGAFNLRRDGRGLSTVEIGNEGNRTSYQRVSGPQVDYPGPVTGYPQPVGNVPSWAVGTFRGMTNNGETDLTIEPGGMVTIRSLNTNQVHSGSYVNGILTFEWGSFRLVRESRGIRTVDVNNQQNRTSYQRVN